MYLIAGKVKANNTFNSWNGKEGKFVKTFGLNTKRNKNEWKVSWKSIKQHINTAINRPGIEFEKCQDGKCDLDHVEAETFDRVIEKQRPFERTRIIDYVLNEETETVDLIHEVLDDEFFEKIKNGKIQYVSAMVWPATGGYEIHGKGRMDLPIVDAEHWRFVHHAFLTDNPAYGKDTAIIKTTCEGKDCQIQMLQSKQFTVSEYDPLSELPMLYRHQNAIHLVSASKKVQGIVLQKQKEGNKINDALLVNAYSMSNESNMKNSPFKACTCKKNRDKMSDNTEIQTLELKLKASEEEKKDMESKLKSSEEEKKDMESKSKSSKARYSKLFAAESDEDSKKMYAKLKASTDDEDELKAMEEGMEDSHTARKSSEEDPKMRDMKSRLQAMEAKESKPMIASLVSIRKGRISDSDLNDFERGLSSKSYKEIESQYESELYLIESSLKSSYTNPTAPTPSHLPFNGAETFSLSSKSLESISGVLE